MTYEQILGADVTSHVLPDLQEDKEYTVSIYAMYPEGPSQPVSVTARTCKRFDFLGSVMPTLICIYKICKLSFAYSYLAVCCTQDSCKLIRIFTHVLMPYPGLIPAHFHVHTCLPRASASSFPH